MSLLSQVLGVLGFCFPIGGVIYFLMKIGDAKGLERTKLRLIVIVCFAIGVLLYGVAQSVQ